MHPITEMRLKLEYAARKEYELGFFAEVFGGGNIKPTRKVYADYTWEEFLEYKEAQRKESELHNAKCDQMKADILTSTEYELATLNDIRLGFKCQTLDIAKAIWVDREVVDFDRDDECFTEFDEILYSIDRGECRKLKQ